MKTRNSALSFAGLFLLAGCQTEAINDLTRALVTNVHVDDDAPPGGDGSLANPFDNLPDAVDHAGGLGGDIRILIEPGEYALTQTLAIDFPVILQGTNVMGDDPDGWPSGLVAPGTETVILSTPTLGPNTLIKVGSETGPVISGLVAFRDLTFDLGPNFANALHIVKAQDFDVRRNLFRGDDANIGVFPVASSGVIADNHMTVGAGISVNAGTPGSPANVEVSGNRAVENGFGGLLLNGSGFDLPETNADQLDVVVTDNDLSNNDAPTDDNTRFGIRVFLIRRDPGRPGDDQDTGNVTALIEDNRIVGNGLGITIDAGFPFRNFGSTPKRCDERVYHGSFDLELTGNDVSGNLRAPALITFTRSSTALNPGELSAWQYLHHATYTISDPDDSLDGFLLDHPANDPFVGPVCPADITPELLLNQLVYNGVTVPNN